MYVTDILQTMEVLMLKSVQFSFANTFLFSMSCGLDKIFNVSILITTVIYFTFVNTIRCIR